MRVLTWVVRLLLFLGLFAFALKNTNIISLYFFFDMAWQAPMVMVLLGAFSAGALFGLLAASSALLSLRREVLKLRRQLAEQEGLEKSQAQVKVQSAGVVAVEAGHA